MVPSSALVLCNFVRQCRRFPGRTDPYTCSTTRWPIPILPCVARELSQAGHVLSSQVGWALGPTVSWALRCSSRICVQRCVFFFILWHVANGGQVMALQLSRSAGWSSVLNNHRTIRFCLRRFFIVLVCFLGSSSCRSFTLPLWLAWRYRKCCWT